MSAGTRTRLLIDLSVAPVGGAGTYAAGFASGLADADLDRPGDLVVVVDARWAAEHGPEVSAVRAAGVVVDAVDVPRPGTWRARLGRGRVLRDAARRHRVDLAYFPREVGARTGRPYVILANNLYAWRSFGSSAAIGGRASVAVLRMMARLSARRAAAVLSVSASLADVIEPVAPVAAVVHHGCDLPEHDRTGTFGPEGRERRAIMVGNVIANKRIEVAIDGVARARRSGQPWTLDVHGARADDRYAAELDDLASARLGASVLRGPAHGDELTAAYQRADVVIVGGAFESFCFPLVEAMRSGCAVVAPECPLVAELCGDVAVTYREGDAASMAAALEQAWDERATRSGAGIEHSRQFSWTRTVTETVDHLRAHSTPRASRSGPAAGSAPPRVLVDLSVAPPGGAQTYAAGFAAGLARVADVDPTSLVVVVDRLWASDNPALVEGLTGAGVEVDAIAFPPPGSWQVRFRRGSILRDALARHGAQVAYFPREVAPRTGCPQVLLARNLYAWERFGSSAAIGGRMPALALRRLAQRCARRAAAVLSVSQVLARRIEAESGRKVAAVVHHGCDLPEGAPRPSALASGEGRIAMVGNVMANKGIDVAVRGVAMAGEVPGGVAWKLDVYGNRSDAAYADEVESLGRQLLGHDVLRGPAFGDDLLDAYRRADVVVMGGTFESFCFPLVEAMRSGCVVVAPDCDLVTELCGDVAVTYVEGDARSLADALAVAGRELVERSRRGIERSRAFTWERAVAQTLDQVRSVVSVDG